MILLKGATPRELHVFNFLQLLVRYRKLTNTQSHSSEDAFATNIVQSAKIILSRKYKGIDTIELCNLLDCTSQQVIEIVLQLHIVSYIMHHVDGIYIFNPNFPSWSNLTRKEFKDIIERNLKI
jgi:hypothetical protein